MEMTAVAKDVSHHELSLLKLFDMQKAVSCSIEERLRQISDQVDFTGSASAQLSYHSLTWSGNNAIIPAVRGLDVLLIPVSHDWHDANQEVVKVILAAPQDAVQAWLPVWASCLVPAVVVASPT